MKCKNHDKHSVFWYDPCVQKKIPDFWKRINNVAWFIGLEATFTSLGKVKYNKLKKSLVRLGFIILTPLVVL